MLDTRRETTGQVSIVGHRGAAACAPENTMAAFRQGLAHGADIIELDVQLTADGHVMVFHDEQLNRTTDGHGPLSTHTLAELKRLDAGSWFGPQFAGEAIPTLEEVLVWAKDKDVPLFVELKYPERPDPALDATVVAALVSHRMLDQVMLISFNHAALQRVKTYHRTLSTGALYVVTRSDPVVLAQEIGANALMPLCHTITAQDIERFHTAGLSVNVWGENADYAGLIMAGVDCVNADDPARVRHDFFEPPLIGR